MSAGYPVKPTINRGTDPIFRPEAYGTPTGTDAATDMPLVQSAIDAAGALGEVATVRLDGSYAVLESADGPANVGVYTNTYYGIWCNYDDLIIDGNGTGTLVLEAMPTNTRYCMLLVGNGGYESGSYPGIDTLLANGDIRTGVKIQNLSTDCSVLTDVNLADLSDIGNVFSANIGFAFCQNFEVDGVTIDKGFGNNGGIGMVATCRNYTIKNCTVTEMYKHGYFADGAKSAEFDNCNVQGQNASSAGDFAISIATSGDYGSYSQDCHVHDCAITGTRDGIAISGEGNIVEDNTITLQDINLTRFGILVTVGYSSARDCDSPGSAIVRRNTIQRPAGATYEKGYGVYVNGRNEGFSGTPLEVHDCQIYENNINRLTYGVVWGQQAKGNSFTDNTLVSCDAVSGDVSGGTSSGNTVSGNDVS